MTNLVEIQNDQVVVSSRQIANNFRKNHQHVLESIRKLLTVENSTVKFFRESSFVNDRGQTYPMYLMNRDGFSLLVMGFTGKKALEWKIKYIEAFNEMERQLKRQSKPLQPTVPSIPSQYKCTIATNDAILMAKSLMQTFHVEDGIAYAKAFDVIGDANSIDFSPIRCLLPSPTKEVAYLNPTAIGKQFNMSAIAINKRLEEEGLQTRVNADWRLTDEGAKYGSEKPYTKNGHSGWQILWSDKIIQFLSSGTTKSILVKN